jgi:hypothetical protein
MRRLPRTSDSLLVRTDFSNDVAWASLLDAVAHETEDGFRAHVTPVADWRFADASWMVLTRAVARNRDAAAVLFVADRPSMNASDHPVLVVSLTSSRAPFRCIASQLWGVENNLNISNMGWDEFAEQTDSEGIFRGFKA